MHARSLFSWPPFADVYYVNYSQSYRHYLRGFTVRRVKRPERKIGDTILMVISCSKEYFFFF